MTSSFLCALAILATAPSYTEGEAQKIFAQGNDAYANGKYEEARDAFRQLVENGVDAPDVLYNLGTAELALNDLGNSVLHLERAKRAPGPTDDVDANLAVARSRQLDQVVSGTFDKALTYRIVDATSENVVSWLFLVSWLLAFATLVVRRWIRRHRLVLSLLTAISLAVSIPSGILLLGHRYLRDTIIEGVVISPTAVAREFPKESLKPLFEIHAGLKVRLLEDSGSYVKIRLPNGLEGWTERRGLAEI